MTRALPGRGSGERDDARRDPDRPRGPKTVDAPTRRSSKSSSTSSPARSRGRPRGPRRHVTPVLFVSEWDSAIFDSAGRSPRGSARSSPTTGARDRVAVPPGRDRVEARPRGSSRSGCGGPSTTRAARPCSRTGTATCCGAWTTRVSGSMRSWCSAARRWRRRERRHPDLRRRLPGRRGPPTRTRRARRSPPPAEDPTTSELAVPAGDRRSRTRPARQGCNGAGRCRWQDVR